MQIEIPVTTYSVRAIKPNQKYGSPAKVPIKDAASRILVRVPVDRIPEDAIITNAKLRFFSDRASTGSKNARVAPITGQWRASVKWADQPTYGAVIETLTKTDPAEGATWDFTVTTWASTRDRNGLRIDSTTATAHWLRGSSAENNQPVLIVTYTLPAEISGDLRPNGGSVSVAAPILTYAGPEDMTAQKIQFSTDGIAVSYDSGWLTASEGYYDPAADPGANPVLVDGGAGIYWRNYTTGPNGDSPASEWAWYDFKSLPVIAFTSPGATTPDGSPTATWTVTGGTQTSWRMKFESGDALVDEARWRDEEATRTWTPGASIPVPDGIGRFELQVRDAVSPRVSAVGAPSTVKVTHEFTTTLDGADTAVNSIGYTFDDPTPVIIGTRAAGVPDEVALVRDGRIVPLWDNDGNRYAHWAPGTDFFTDTAFSLPDRTASLHATHEWSVRVRTGGALVSAEGPTVTQYVNTESVWLLNPRTGARVEIMGWEGTPVVDQSTEEASVLHVPLNQGPVVEPIRRRLIRSTRMGTVTGVVQNEQEAILDEWVAGDSSDRYRLIFGKVNWSVIIGDYNPNDVVYMEDCGPDRVLVSFNWWQRLADG